MSKIFFIDPYVKVWLMFGDKRVEKKKTPIYKCNLNPIFNATFEFDVPWEQIRDCALDIQVKQWFFTFFALWTPKSQKISLTPK